MMEDEKNKESGGDCIKVAVRCRPFNSREKGDASCIKFDPDRVTLINPTNNEEHSFSFDLIYNQDSEQHQLWDSIGIPMLNKAFSGYNGTIFAYGQTGSGKTWFKVYHPKLNDFKLLFL